VNLFKLIPVIFKINKIERDIAMTTKWWEQRRVWAAIVSIVIMALGVFKINLNLDESAQQIIVDNISNIATAVGAAITGILAILSYIKPKAPK
jgi:hypothetical protein